MAYQISSSSHLSPLLKVSITSRVWIVNCSPHIPKGLSQQLDARVEKFKRAYVWVRTRRRLRPLVSYEIFSEQRISILKSWIMESMWKIESRRIFSSSVKILACHCLPPMTCITQSTKMLARTRRFSVCNQAPPSQIPSDLNLIIMSSI